MTTTLPLISDLLPVQHSPGSPSFGELRTAEGRLLPLRSVELDVSLTGLFASGVLRQRFENTSSEPVEVVYVFPLPSRAAVSRFSAVLGGRKVEGRLEERGRAREVYEEAIASGQRAALAEEDRPEVFTVTVGNLLVGEEAVVELTVTQPLAVEGSTATFRFPFVVAPRYTDGVPLGGDQAGDGVAKDTDAVPDASRISPPRLLEEEARPELSVRLTLSGMLPHSNLRSSLHALVEEAPADGPVRLSVSPGDRLDRDLVLRFDLVEELASSALLVPDQRTGTEVPDLSEGSGTWSLTLVPPPAVRAPRSVVVVLDRSGSMQGWKMVAARRAAARIVDSLDVQDRFAVLAFDDVSERPDGLSEGLVEASDRNRFAAVSWLASLEARGGTVMLSPLQEAASLLSDRSRECSVVLVTDGQVSGEDQILRFFSGGVRVFTVGVDRAVNAGFLERLASSTRGSCFLVESEDRLDDALVSVTRTVGSPALLDVSVSGDGVTLVEGTAAPSQRSDAFAGLPLVLSGRYRTTLSSGHLVVSARTPGGEAFSLRVPAAMVSSPAVPMVWARARVRDLEDRVATLRRGEDREALVARVVAHSLRYGVLSRFTAFVAVDPEDTGAAGMSRHVQPVESPSGWAVRGGMVAFAAAPAGGMLRSAVSAQSFSSNTFGSVPMSAPAPFASVPVESVFSPPAFLRSVEEVAADVRAALRSGDRRALETLLLELDSSSPSVLCDELRVALRSFLADVSGDAAPLEALLVRILPTAPQRPPLSRREFWRS